VLRKAVGITSKQQGSHQSASLSRAAELMSGKSLPLEKHLPSIQDKVTSAGFGTNEAIAMYQLHTSKAQRRRLRTGPSAAAVACSINGIASIAAQNSFAAQHGLEGHQLRYAGGGYDAVRTLNIERVKALATEHKVRIGSHGGLQDPRIQFATVQYWKAVESKDLVDIALRAEDLKVAQNECRSTSLRKSKGGLKGSYTGFYGGDRDPRLPIAKANLIKERLTRNLEAIVLAQEVVMKAAEAHVTSRSIRVSVGSLGGLKDPRVMHADAELVKAILKRDPASIALAMEGVTKAEEARQVSRATRWVWGGSSASEKMTKLALKESQASAAHAKVVSDFYAREKERMMHTADEKLEQNELRVAKDKKKDEDRLAWQNAKARSWLLE
jgi:hypothetical protein